jgi:hypothetical protein
MNFHNCSIYIHEHLIKIFAREKSDLNLLRCAARALGDPKGRKKEGKAERLGLED